MSSTSISQAVRALRVRVAIAAGVLLYVAIGTVSWAAGCVDLGQFIFYALALPIGLYGKWKLNRWGDWFGFLVFIGLLAALRTWFLTLSCFLNW